MRRNNQSKTKDMNKLCYVKPHVSWHVIAQELGFCASNDIPVNSVQGESLEDSGYSIEWE